MPTATRAVLVPLFVLLVAPLLFAELVFAEPAAPPPAVDEAALLQQLKTRDPLMQEVRSGDRPDSKIIGLFGDLIDPAANKPATAQAFVTQYGAILGFPAGGMPAEMKPQPEVQREKGVTITYFPENQGVRYPKGAVSFGFTPGGKLMSVTGRFKSAASAAMGGETAETAARKALVEMHKMFPGSWLTGAGTLHESLEDTDDGKSIRRVWRVRASMGDKRRPLLVSMGPGGEVLDKGSSAEEADGSGKVYTAYPDIPVGDGALPKLNSTSSFSGLWGEHFEADSSFPIIARIDDGARADYEPLWFTQPVSGSTPARPWWDPRFLEVNVYHHLMVAHDKALAFGARPEEVNAKKIKFDVYQPPVVLGTDSNGNPDYGGTMNNGVFTGTDRIFFARDNPRWEYRSTAQDISIIYHEYGHYLARQLNSTTDQGGTVEERCEARAIGEGWADAFACSITNQPHTMSTWKAGDTTEPTGIRDATRPPPGLDYCSMFPCEYGTFCQPAGVKVLPDGNNSACHWASRLFSVLCWSMRKECFRDSGDWLMLRLIWAMRDTAGPQTMQRFCQQMLVDEILYCHATDDAQRSRFVKMYNLMQVHKLYNRTCP